VSHGPSLHTSPRRDGDTACGPPEGPQRRAERGSCPFTRVAVPLTSAVPIIVPGPLVDAVVDRGMSWITPPVALPRIGVQPRAASRKVFDDAPMTSPPVRVVAHPKPLLSRLTRDSTDERRPIIGVGAVAYAHPRLLDIEHQPTEPPQFCATIEHITTAGPLVKVELVTETGTVVHVEVSQERYRQLELHRGAEVFVRVKDMQVFPQPRHGHQPDQYVERVQGVSATRSK
jgi:TOBE domain-containing protein